MSDYDEEVIQRKILMKTLSMKGSVRVRVEVNCEEHSCARLERILPSTFVADLCSKAVPYASRITGHDMTISSFLK